MLLSHLTAQPAGIYRRKKREKILRESVYFLVPSPTNIEIYTKEGSERGGGVFSFIYLSVFFLSPPYPTLSSVSSNKTAIISSSSSLLRG